MRRLLAAMRQDGDDLELAPQPGLDSVGSLVADVERAGLPATLLVEGDAVPSRVRSTSPRTASCRRL